MKPPESEPEMADDLRRQIAFYRDIGVKEIYRRRPSGAKMTKPTPAASRAFRFDLPAQETTPAGSISVAPPGVAPAPAPIVSMLPNGIPPLAPPDDTLLKIQQDIGDCRRCRLCEQRSKIVFGSGNESAALVFVGEGPGADEDAQGLPFVGRAGQLLTQMIDGTASKEGIPVRRTDVYICNVVKCRPPENRTPQPDEMEICGQFLFRQLLAIRPKAICALGSTAAKALLSTKDGVTRLRGHWHKWRDIPVMVTYHPSYLLRPYNQNAKREAWEDLKKVMHFVYD